jgi:hypothetical protein
MAHQSGKADVSAAGQREGRGCARRSSPGRTRRRTRSAEAPFLGRCSHVYGRPPRLPSPLRCGCWRCRCATRSRRRDERDAPLAPGGGIAAAAPQPCCADRGPQRPGLDGRSDGMCSVRGAWCLHPFQKQPCIHLLAWGDLPTRKQVVAWGRKRGKERAKKERRAVCARARPAPRPHVLDATCNAHRPVTGAQAWRGRCCQLGGGGSRAHGEIVGLQCRRRPGRAWGAQAAGEQKASQARGARWGQAEAGQRFPRPPRARPGVLRRVLPRTAERRLPVLGAVLQAMHATSEAAVATVM